MSILGSNVHTRTSECAPRFVSILDSAKNGLVYTSQIRPSMDYGCEIWGTNNTKGMRDMEPIHLKFLKAVLGVRKQTTSAAVYADTGSSFKNKLGGTNT